MTATTTQHNTHIPTWATTESPQPDGTCSFTADQVTTRDRKGEYAVETTMYWSSDTPATRAEVVITPKRDELDFDAATAYQLAADMTALGDALRAADREAGL